MDVSSRRIVLLGKTGAGKSSLANTIFGEKVFEINHLPITVEYQSSAVTKCVDGKNITLIDTHGFFDTSESEETLKADILRCITECAPGPHAFLIVLKVEKFTKQEEEVIKQIRRHFSEDALKYSAVVFTHGDQLADGQTIEDFVGGNKGLSGLVKECGGRCHVVDSKYWKGNEEDGYRNNRLHVAELLKTTEKITEANGGQCYTNEILKEVKSEMRKKEEHIGQTSGDMSQEVIRTMAKMSVFETLQIRFTGVAAGVLLGALLGVAQKVTSPLRNVQGLSDIAALASSFKETVLSEALTGAFKGAVLGYESSEGATSPSEALDKTIKAYFTQKPAGADEPKEPKKPEEDSSRAAN